MNRRAFLPLLALSPLLAAGCGSGTSVNNITGGGSAIVTGTNRSVVAFGPGDPAAAERVFYNGARTVRTSAGIVLTGSDFGGGSVGLPIPIPGFPTLSRYAISFADEPDVQSDLSVAGGGNQLTGNLHVPEELLTPSERVKPRLIKVYDRLERRYIPFSPAELATITIQITGGG